MCGCNHTRWLDGPTTARTQLTDRVTGKTDHNTVIWRHINNTCGRLYSFFFFQRNWVSQVLQNTTPALKKKKNVAKFANNHFYFCKLKQIHYFAIIVIMIIITNIKVIIINFKFKPVLIKSMKKEKTILYLVE